MKSILHQLYGGEINPYEETCVTTNDYRRVNRQIQAEKRYFTERMSADDRKRFEALENLYGDSSEMESQKAFCIGFKLAARLLCAVFADEPEPIREPLE
ncbi:hypothetical protein LJC07_00555 [Christensenellaceae bacterium OttesenSCG-928-L17]|nr:hypothetical protein [Christensenellaceae bacterium OttesenSCG-928-L17]